jgi:hypothetical protein
MTSQLIVSGLALGSIYALLALSLVYPEEPRSGGLDRYMGLGVTEYAPRGMSAEETRGLSASGSAGLRCPAVNGVCEKGTLKRTSLSVHRIAVTPSG